MQPMHVPPSDQEPLTFGKHRGKTLLDVVTSLPDYCRWILKTSRTSKSQCAGFDRFVWYLWHRPEFAQEHAELAKSQAPASNSPQPPIPKSCLPERPPFPGPPHLMAPPPMWPPLPAGGFHACWPPAAFPATPMLHGAGQLAPPLPVGGPTSSACDAAQPDRKRRKHKHGPSLQTLSGSSFLKLYRAAPERPTAEDCLLAIGTSSDLEDVASSLSALPAKDPGALDAYVVKLWAILKGRDKKKGGVDFYKLLNDAVIADDAERLRSMMPIARVLNKILVSYFPSADTVTWRGSRMTLAQLGEMHVGASYRVGMFVASSLDFEVAERFVRFEPDRVIVQLRIPQNCHNAGFLGIEYYPEQEREYLMPPYTAVEIFGKSRIKEYVLLTVRVYRDNKDAPLDLPSILI
mmetsp:Transcript_13023/g.27081  ORF Transcript_13023/g.27081 Transcript_13023/m.27081 type:complete len:405 (-) Transcript_13023:53-1267(-)